MSPGNRPPRRLIDSPALSWGAKGVLAYLLVHEGSPFHPGDLAARSPTDSVIDVREWLEELERAGHVNVNAASGEYWA